MFSRENPFSASQTSPNPFPFMLNIQNADTCKETGVTGGDFAQ